MRHFLTIIGFSLFSFLVFFNQAFAQKTKHHGIEDHDMWMKYKKAENLWKQHSYYNAIDVLKEITEKLDTNDFVNYKLGSLYFVSRDYENANIWLEKVAENQQKEAEYPMALYKHAQSLQMTGDYEMAKVWFYKFIRLKNKSGEMKYLKKNARQLLRSCNYAIEELRHDSSFVNINTLKGEVNKAYTDFAPVALSDNELMFASLRSDSIVKYDYDSEGFYPVKLYRSKKQGGSWSQPEEMASVNDPFEHTANGVYSKDSNLFFFTRCYQNTHNEIICAIYMSEKENDSWSDPKKLPKKVNVHRYTSTQPTLGYAKKGRGKKAKNITILYFVSNKPGGKGGNDIWHTTMDEDGKFSTPVNCNRINTPMDETSPYYDTDKKLMYFSSPYHLGFGGQDIFSAYGYMKRWKDITNLRFPVNSSYDDTYYSPNKDSSTVKANHGYLVSNRPGGKALKSATCCDDIYSFQNYIPEFIYIDHFVYRDSSFIDSVLMVQIDSVKGDTTSFYKPKTVKIKVPFVSAKVGIVKTKYVIDTSLTDYSLYKEYIEWIDTIQPNNTYPSKLIKGKSYTVVVDQQGYIPVVKNLDSIAESYTGAEPVRNEIRLEKIKTYLPIEDSSLATAEVDTLKRLSLDLDKKDLKKNTVLLLDNMYFDTDSDIVQKRSTSSLYLLLTFMEEKSFARIEIGGHTDSDGTNEHNKDLSQRRANTVRNFLIENGVDPKRITAVGYGENKPVATNQTAEGKQRNRRTEVKIL